jgi:acyl-CoA reductase-like NAD-dependent aldehyde dehydrogenase
MRHFEVVSPLDDQVLGVYETPAESEVRQAVTAARGDFDRWSALPVAKRVRAVGELRRLIHREIDSIVDLIHRVSGKVPTEVLLGEIYPTLDQLRYYENHAARILARRRVPTSSLAYPHAHAYVERRPYGVTAVISPWNFPFQLAVIPVVTALMAGNTVCLKPSELSLPVGDLILDLFRRVEEFGPALQVIPGDGETGRQLIEAGPDLIFFTGSIETGKKIMTLAAQSLTPLILELGGKDPMLVFDDAPRERAVRAAVYGAFSNSGQVCIAVERAYVQRGIYQEFVNAVIAETTKLRVGSSVDHELGAISSPRQIAIIEDHYRDALEKGAQISGPLRRDGAFVQPVVLWDVNHSMKIMREETFGPLLPIMPFDTEDEAIRFANDSPYGLNGSVWTVDSSRGRRVTGRLRLGGCAVNDVIKNVGHTGLPFGGVKQSGFGRYHGPEGLVNFTMPVSILANTGRLPTEPNWFPYSAQHYRALRGFVDFSFGEGSVLNRLRRNWQSLQNFRRYFTLNLREQFRRLP